MNAASLAFAISSAVSELRTALSNARQAQTNNALQEALDAAAAVADRISKLTNMAFEEAAKNDDSQRI